jgi:hypothetical protein
MGVPSLFSPSGSFRGSNFTHCPTLYLGTFIGLSGFIVVGVAQPKDSKIRSIRSLIIK